MLAIVRGLLAGFVLSAARAPLGIDPFREALVDARTSHGWRSGALLAIAVGLFLARQATLPVRFLFAGVVGFCLHALVIAGAWSPSSPLELAATLLVGLVALAVPDLARGEPEDAEPPTFLELLGIAGAGAGAAIAVEGVARHVRLLGGTLAQDDSVFAVVFILCAAAGGAAFGWLASARALRGISLPAGLAAAAAGTFASLLVVQRLAFPDTYRDYLRHFGLDSSLRGTIQYDALIGAACFVAPGLLLGAALLGARGRKRILAVLVGAALGLSLLPGLLALVPGSTPADVEPSATELVPLGCLVACGGAALAVLSLQARGAAARWSGIAAVVVLAAPALLVPVKPIHVLAPWAARRTFPLIVSDVPEGLLSVETFGLLGGAWAFATIDRRAISPTQDEIAADAAVFRGSFELLPAARRSAGGIRVLLLGQLTPERARMLAECGASLVDRSAAWHAAMGRIEDVMWSQLPDAPARPEGSILALREARERLAGGRYDLVIAPPVAGDAPRTRAIEAPASTTVVRWLRTDEPLASRDLGDEVAWTSDGLDQPAVGMLTNAAAGEGAWAPLLLDAGEPRPAPTPLAWLRRRKSERGDARADTARAALTERFAKAARGTPREDLAEAIAAFHSAQERSSQFETPEQRTELPEAALSRFRAAAIAEVPGPYLRRTWESLARILVRKRWIEEIYAYVEPVARARAPWPALEIALARADLEALAPADAVGRLSPLAAGPGVSFELFDVLGRARCELGEKEAAVETWKRAVAFPIEPGYDIGEVRRVVLAVARAGDPAGIELARRILLVHPEDRELRAVLEQPPGSGPAPDPCAR